MKETTWRKLLNKGKLIIEYSKESLEDAKKTLATIKNPKLRAVATAYADSWMKDKYGAGKTLRNLSFKGSYLSAEEFLEAVKKYVIDYNNFDYAVAKRLVDYFGVGNIYRLAREGSVAVYIKTSSDKADIEKRPEFQELWKKIKADEKDYNTSTKELRLWWD